MREKAVWLALARAEAAGRRTELTYEQNYVLDSRTDFKAVTQLDDDDCLQERPCRQLRRYSIVEEVFMAWWWKGGKCEYSRSISRGCWSNRCTMVCTAHV